MDQDEFLNDLLAMHGASPCAPSYGQQVITVPSSTISPVMTLNNNGVLVSNGTTISSSGHPGFGWNSSFSGMPETYAGNKIIYIEPDDSCSFCGDMHCATELTLRPLYREIDAFIYYNGLSQQFLIENAQLLVDFNNAVINYTVGDIKLGDMTFGGNKNYYFGESLDIVAKFFGESNATNKILRMNEISSVLNNLRFQSKEKLEKHGIKIIT